MELLDCKFQKSTKNAQTVYGKVVSVLNAIKNILLMTPGNIVSLPECGIDIPSYKFEFADDETISALRTRISRHITTYIPSLEGCTVDVAVTDDANNANKKGLTITIQGYMATTERELHLKYNVTRNRNGTVAMQVTTF